MSLKVFILFLEKGVSEGLGRGPETENVAEILAVREVEVEIEDGIIQDAESKK